jgi:hypothetical protein
MPKHPDCLKPWCGVDGKQCIDCGKYERNQMNKVLPFFAARLPNIRLVGRELGYAIGLHGSGRRDLDLIAVPWTDQAKPALELVEAICAAVDGSIVEYPGVERNPAHRAHGRRAWAIHFGGKTSNGRYLDLSVMPLATDEAAIAAEQRAGRAEDLLQRLYEWDVMTIPNSDGQFWRSQITALLQNG